MNTVRMISVMLFSVVLSLGASAKKKAETFDAYEYGAQRQGTTLTVTFEKGRSHNHPLFAVWLADEQGQFIETLYVSESIGKGVFPRADRNKGAWMAGPIQRPAALPYWAHQRGILNDLGTYNPTPAKPEVDAVTGATPGSHFVMRLTTSQPLKGRYRLMLELNQSWDWNDFWYNDKFPNDAEYKTSSQPALVYQVVFDTACPDKTYAFKPVGHSHYAGKDGSLTPDLSTLTTALRIAKNITLLVP